MSFIFSPNITDSIDEFGKFGDGAIGLLDELRGKDLSAGGNGIGHWFITSTSA